MCYVWHDLTISRTYLNEEPRSEKSQATVLPIEPIVIRVKCKVIKIKESQPVAFADIGMATNGIVLVCDPYNEDDVESCGGVIEKF